MSILTGPEIARRVEVGDTVYVTNPHVGAAPPGWEELHSWLHRNRVPSRVLAVDERAWLCRIAGGLFGRRWECIVPMEWVEKGGAHAPPGCECDTFALMRVGCDFDRTGACRTRAGSGTRAGGG